MEYLYTITVATYYLAAAVAIVGLAYGWWESRKEQPKRP